jgi:TPR repeat protein
VYILRPSIPKGVEGYRWQSFTPPAAAAIPPLPWTNLSPPHTGDADAQFALGFMYANGHGVPQDHVEAATWYRAAAEQGEAHAQASLGVMYRYGKGVLLDLVLAHMWFNLSAVRGDPVSVELRDQTAKIMTREQIAEAQQLAHEWKPTK